MCYSIIHNKQREEVMEDIFRLDSDGRASNKRYSAGLVIYMMMVGYLSGRKDVKGVYRMIEALSESELELLGIRSRRFLPKKIQFYNILNNIVENELSDLLNKFVIRNDDNSEIKQICIDGKRLRASRVGEVRGVHIIEAFAEEIRHNITQEVMREGEDEVGAAMRVLGRLELKDSVITADAIYAKKNFVKKIKEKNGEFLIAVKDNNKSLKKKLEASFEAEEVDSKRDKKNISKSNSKQNSSGGNPRKSTRKS
jgi:predicted transposase YbfD/YdcC